MAALWIVGSAISVGVGAVTGALVLNSVLIGLGLGIVSGWIFCGAALARCILTGEADKTDQPRVQTGPIAGLPTGL